VAEIGALREDDLAIEPDGQLFGLPFGGSEASTEEVFVEGERATGRWRLFWKWQRPADSCSRVAAPRERVRRALSLGGRERQAGRAASSERSASGRVLVWLHLEAHGRRQGQLDLCARIQLRAVAAADVEHIASSGELRSGDALLGVEIPGWRREIVHTR
jgi:hypothetical protein